jgi:7,8-dihydropterin-6-yl-methyl-4-(beta-D-ribofuranosyl)aminobenzene 5'-phosphate synthase
MGERGLGAEHGLSIFFKWGAKRFLFDTGQSSRFLKNAAKIGIDLSQLDYVILSHGHYDHTGGLQFLPENCGATLVAHPDYRFPKYDGERFIGTSYAGGLLKKLSRMHVALTPKVHFLGEIPGERKPFGEYVAADGVRRGDMLYDDTGVVVLDNGKAIVLCGCAHSGIVNIVEYAKNLFSPEKIVLIGGLHMHDYGIEEIQKTAAELKALGVTEVYCGHCTGEEATDALLSAFRGCRLSSGMKIIV